MIQRDSPDGQPVANGADLDGGPPHLVTEVDQFDAEISAAEDAAIGVVADIVDGVSEELERGVRAVGQVAERVFASVDTELATPTAGILRLVDKLLVDTQKTVTSAENRIDSSGITYPGSVYTIQQELDSDDPTPIVTRILEGVEVPAGFLPEPPPVAPKQPDPEAPTPPAGGGCPDTESLEFRNAMRLAGWAGPSYRDGRPVYDRVVTATTAFPWNPSEYDPPGVSIEWQTEQHGDRGSIWTGSFCGATFQLTIFPPVGAPPTGPPAPPDPPEPPPDCPPPEVCCPDPIVNVTVTVPPITIPPPPDRPAPPAGPGAPPGPAGTVPPNQPGPVNSGLWSHPDICRAVSRTIGTLEAAVPPGDPPPGQVRPKWNNWFTEANDAYFGWIPWAGPQIASYLNDAGEAGAKHLIEASTGAALGEAIVKHAGGLDLASPNAALQLAPVLGAAAWSQSISGMPVRYLTQSLEYTFQFANPQYLPGQNDIDGMWLRGVIHDVDWECLTKAQGNIPHWHRLARDAGQRFLGVDEIIRLALRNELVPGEFEIRMRQAGVHDPLVAAKMLSLATQIPTQPDLLRMMVRDAADEDVVRSYGYDTDFNLKFAGPLREWALAQGIPEEIFLYYWRAHWEIPSNTQLYEMFQRLRPDRPEIADWERRLADAELAGDPAAAGPRPPIVTLPDVLYALQVNDRAPNWIGASLAIAYHPLTRTDAVRAYEIGTLDETALYHVMRDNGYDDTNARTLVTFYSQQKSRRTANATGVLTIRKIVKLYKGGGMTRREAVEAMGPLLPNPEKADELLARADVEVQAELRQAMVRASERKVFVGEWSAREGLDAVIRAGVEDSRAREIVAGWVTKRDGRSKEPRVAELCGWAKDGLITTDEQIRRLVNLGYSDGDAYRYVYGCQKKEFERRQKLEQQRLERIRREQAKEQKEREKREKEEARRAAGNGRPAGG